MNNEPIPAAVSQEAAGYKSRWGHHPLSYEDWKNLKAARWLYSKYQHQMAAHERWSRKLPENRVIRTYSRNEKGQRTGVASTRPMPEPATTAAVAFEGQTMWFLRLYSYGRRPQPQPVTPITEIEVALLQKWAARAKDLGFGA